jgi:hypothetical protein
VIHILLPGKTEPQRRRFREPRIKENCKNNKGDYFDVFLKKFSPFQLMGFSIQNKHNTVKLSFFLNHNPPFKKT